MAAVKTKALCISGRTYDAEGIKQLRNRLDMSQPEFAKQFNIPLPTLRAWEQSQNPPSQLANSLLEVIDTVSLKDENLELV